MTPFDFAGADKNAADPADDAGIPAPHYFLDPAYDGTGADGDWWLDVNPVTLPSLPGV